VYLHRPAHRQAPGSLGKRITISLQNFATTVIRAIRRARLSILTIAATYAISLIVGIVMVHAGNLFALHFEDQLVSQASQKDPAALAAGRGNAIQAALLDFSANLFVGAMPKTVSGFAIIFPYPMVAYQGWVGGIVSVRADHTSRLNDPRSAAYYLLTLLLQLLPYSLAIGAGVNCGVSLFRPQPCYQGRKWLGLFPREALLDLARIYSLVVPLLLIASLWEFLSPWNL
jgi:hypothetical protein